MEQIEQRRDGDDGYEDIRLSLERLDVALDRRVAHLLRQHLAPTARFDPVISSPFQASTHTHTR